MDLTTFLAFFVASWLISLSPGAGAIYAMSCGLAHGFRRGFVAVFGLILGIWTLMIVAVVGIGAILASSVFFFSVVKWLGVAYLLYLGVQQWRAPANPIVTPDNGGMDANHQTANRYQWHRLVVKGWAINATNPKGILFMLAVVPQFLDLSKPLGAQYFIIAATLAFTDFVVMAGYTLLAAKVLRLLKSYAQVQMMNRIFGGLFVAAALLLANFKRQL
jgi:homoserine/homoserine lactone efflux protein